MNKLFLTFILSIFVYAASAQGINFQGVARSANGTIIASANISLRLSIISKNVDATPEYIETKTVVTNAQGIFSIVVGDATNAVVTGNFKNIAWKDGIKFLKVEMDPSAGTNYINMGTTQLQYVPYSFYSLGVDAANVTGVLPIEKGGTGVASISDLKIALVLDKVSNTADIDKPISTLTQTAIDAKLNKIDTASLSNRIDEKFSKSGVVPIENGGTGVNDLNKLKAVLKLDTSSLSLATVTSSSATLVSATGATILGNIISDGGSTILKKGICFDTISVPNTSVSQVYFIDYINSGTYLTGIFDATITNIYKPNTKYYYRTFAINKNGTAYSEVKSFTTLNIVSFLNNPTVLLNSNMPIFEFSVKTLGDTLKSFYFRFKENGLALPGDALDQNVTLYGTIADTLIRYSYPKYLNANKNYSCEIYLNSNRGTVSKEVTFSTSPITLPIVETNNVSRYQIVQDLIGVSSKILSKGGASNISYGVIWTTSSNTNPDISLSTKTLSFTVVSSPLTTLNSNIAFSQFNPGLTYYFTAFASNSAGTAYANTIPYTIPSSVPSLTTYNALTIEANSAILWGAILNNGGANITNSGFVWSTNSNPTIDLPSKTTNGTTSGTYSSSITGLAPATLYYFRSYASNSLGINYGTQSSFRTLANVPILSETLTPTINTLGNNSALTGGIITNSNGSDIIERGVLYGLNSIPTYPTSNTGQDYVVADNQNNFNVICIRLSRNRTYYFRAYAKNADGIGYASVKSLFIPPDLPNISIMSSGGITSTSIIVTAEAYTFDESVITNRGFVWSTSPSPLDLSLSTKISSSTTNISFSNNITGLIPNTTYHIRGFATNSFGTNYSGTITFTTNP